jgi:hypothetical protein
MQLDYVGVSQTRNGDSLQNVISRSIHFIARHFHIHSLHFTMDSTNFKSAFCTSKCVFIYLLTHFRNHSKGVSYGFSACGVMRAKCRRAPSSQSRSAECAVTRFWILLELGRKQLILATHVPDHYSSSCPFHPCLEVLTFGYVVIQEVKEGIALLLLVANNLAGNC